MGVTLFIMLFRYFHGGGWVFRLSVTSVTILHVKRSLLKIGSITLSSRREATAMATSLKLLGGRCRGKLQELVPELQCVRSSRMNVGGLQMVPYPRSKYPLDRFRNSYLGIRHKIWQKIPQEIIRKGTERGWFRIIKQCKKFLINK